MLARGCFLGRTFSDNIPNKTVWWQFRPNPMDFDCFRQLSTFGAAAGNPPTPVKSTPVVGIHDWGPGPGSGAWGPGAVVRGPCLWARGPGSGAWGAGPGPGAGVRGLGSEIPKRAIKNKRAVKSLLAPCRLQRCSEPFCRWFAV